jgi:hypothetical protein
LYPRWNFFKITNVLSIHSIVFIFDLINFKFEQLIFTLRRVIFYIDLVSSWHKLINQIFTRLTKGCKVSPKFKKLNVNPINIFLKTYIRKCILNCLFQALYFLCFTVHILFIYHLNQYIAYIFIYVHKWALLEIHAAIWNWKRLILSIIYF